MPSVTFVVDAETPQQSEQAELHGQRALTPLISGSVSGGAIGVAWIIGLLIYFYKRWQGHKAVRRAGLHSHRELDIPPPKPEPYIIPPDPAIIQGFRAPGERVVIDDPRADGDGHPKHARTVPFARTEEKAERGEQGEKEDLRAAAMGQTVSAPQIPARVALPSPSSNRDRLESRSLSPRRSSHSARS